MLNFKIRFKQQWFWITLIPLLFLLVDQCVGLYQVIQEMTIMDALSGGVVEALVLKIIGLIFSILALIGFPVDLTVDGYGDSAAVLDRDELAPNAAETAMEELKIGGSE